jgi:hypothetical protein
VESEGLNIETEHLVFEVTVKERFRMLEESNMTFSYINVDVMFSEFSPADEVGRRAGDVKNVCDVKGSRTIRIMTLETNISSADGSGSEIFFEALNGKGLDRLVIFEKGTVVENVAICGRIIITNVSFQCVAIEDRK